MDDLSRNAVLDVSGYDPPMSKREAALDLDRTLVTVLVPVETATYSTTVTPSHVAATVTLRQLLAAANEPEPSKPPREWKPGDRVTVGSYSFISKNVAGKTGTVVSVAPNTYGNRGGFAVAIQFDHLPDAVECHSDDLTEERDT